MSENMKLLLIGESPSRTSSKAEPFDASTKSGRKLLDLFDADSLDDFAVVANLLEEWPGPSSSGKGSASPEKVEEAMSEARRIERSVSSQRKRRFVCAMLFGKRVASAFGFLDATYFRQQCSFGSVPVYVVPHPSRVNRWWNDEANEARAREFFSAMRRQCG